MIRFGRYLGLLILMVATPTWAQQNSADTRAKAEELAKKLSNPISSLVSVPFQYNWENGVGPENDTRFILNLQPVIPLGLSENWNVIFRWIMPYVGQPSLAAGIEPASGFSDIVFSTFFSPASGKLVWGVGPVLILPATNEPTLGTQKWSIGPTGVVLKQQGPWTYGILANHVWSFVGNDNRGDVNQSFFQPFLAYTTPKAVTLSVNSEATANWEASTGQKWTVPLNAQVTKVVKVGPFPASLGAGVGAFLQSPNIGPDWKLRILAVILLPRTQ